MVHANNRREGPELRGSPYRRLTAVFLGFLLTVLSVSSVFPASARGNLIVRGDVNGDRTLSAMDYLLLKRCVLRTAVMTEEGKAAADVTGDGRVNSADYMYLKRQLMEKKKFAEPYIYLPGEGEKFASRVSVGKQYTVNIAPGEKYPDPGSRKLTNGVLAPRQSSSYTNESLVGYPAAKAPVKIVVDLGEKLPGLYRFEVSYLSTREAGIGPLVSAEISLSDDGISFESAGKCLIPAYRNRMQTASLELETPVAARYVRFTVVGEAYWTFLDEVSVIADTPVSLAHEKYLSQIDRLYASDGGTPALAGGTVPDRSKTRWNIAERRTYTLSFTPTEGDEDPENVLLTDGVINTGVDGGNWVGIPGKTGGSAVIDLGSVREDLAAFEARACRLSAAGIEFPSKITVSVSKDGKSWTDVSRCYAPVPATDTDIFRYPMELPETVSARFVRFDFAPSACEKLLIGELSVFVYSDEIPDLAGPYHKVVLPETDGKTYWAGTEEELKKERNLLKGLPVEISLPGSALSTAPEDNTPTGSLALTDGKISPNLNIHDPAYVKFRADAYRLLFFDLNRTSSVSSVDISFAYISRWAVNLPNTVEIFVSLNGKTWYTACSVRPDPDREETHIRVHAPLPQPTAARFISIRFDVPSWVGIDEIEANGTRGLLAGTVMPDSGVYPEEDLFAEEEITGWAVPSPELLGGASDIFLAYHNAKNVRTEEDLIYQIGYVGKDGKIRDTMFDGVLFLMAGEFPSGLGGGTGGVLNYNRSDVEWLLDSLFKKGQNVSALDAAAGRLKRELSLPDDYKVRYYLSFYLPSCDDFGDIDGDGVSEDVSTPDGKLKVLRWILEKTEETLAKQTFRNVVFGGYYWYNEAMASDKSDVGMLQAFTDDIRAKGRQSFWIPYYSAYGWSEWKTYGLDSACLQPNYAFNTNVPDSRLTAAARLAAYKGMSIEIEMDSRSLTDPVYLDRYFSYLEHGARLGFMNDTVHLYYMASGSLSRFANSDEPLSRLLYENTYHFIKKDLQTSPDAPEGASFKAKKGQVLTGRAGENDGTYLYRLIRSPMHGAVALEDNGVFTYYPDPGYEGEDDFLFAVSRHMNNSEPASVRITVG